MNVHLYRRYLHRDVLPRLAAEFDAAYYTIGLEASPWKPKPRPKPRPK